METKKLLHVGCGPKQKNSTSKGFNSDSWVEIRYDIDEAAEPDIIGSMINMSAVETNSMDAIFSSHNIEHVYPHEVSIVLSEFYRVLAGDGFLAITCPDLKSVAKLVAEDRLTEPAYQSPAGPIAPIDILYGHRVSMSAGNLYMAHRCGFTEKVLRACLLEAGFISIASSARTAPFFDLWAVASKTKLSDEDLKSLFQEYTNL